MPTANSLLRARTEEQPMTNRPNLMTVEAAKGLSVQEVRSLFDKHLNPGQLHFLKLLGFDEVLVKRAEGMYYYDQNGFTLLPNRRRVTFGDLNSLEEAFKTDPSIGTFIVETVQGGAGIVAASESYWKGVRQLCDRYGVVWLADEVQCGVGRTGKFF